MFDGAVTGMTLRRIRPEMYNWWKWLPAGIHAAGKIYAAKGRPSDNPLIAHVSCAAEVTPLVKYIPEAGKKLMDAFWPGPLTIIFPNSDIVP